MIYPSSKQLDGRHLLQLIYIWFLTWSRFYVVSVTKEQFLLPSQKKKLRAERAAMQPQYDPNDPDAIVPVQEEMIEAAPGQQLVTRPHRIFSQRFYTHIRAVVCNLFFRRDIVD